MDYVTRVLEMMRDGILSITDEGHVYRHKRHTRAGLRPLQTPRRIDCEGGKGYRRIHIQIDGKVRNVSVARLIWTNAHGTIPDGIQINHKNGDKTDNRLDNLELATASENIRHSYEHLDRPRPWSNTDEWRGKPMITEAQKVEIARRRKSGDLLRHIAADYNISTSHTHRISRGTEVE